MISWYYRWCIAKLETVTIKIDKKWCSFNGSGGSHGRDRMVVGLLLDITLCDKVCQWLATDRWFSPGTLVSSTSKSYRHDITEILLKMTLNTITPPFLMVMLCLLCLYKCVIWFHRWKFDIYSTNNMVLQTLFTSNQKIRVITKLPNSEQSYKGKVKTHKYINRQNQSTTGKLWKS
jgi:hypothetical protein